MRLFRCNRAQLSELFLGKKCVYYYSFEVKLLVEPDWLVNVGYEEANRNNQEISQCWAAWNTRTNLLQECGKSKRALINIYVIVCYMMKSDLANNSWTEQPMDWHYIWNQLLVLDWSLGFILRIHFFCLNWNEAVYSEPCCTQGSRNWMLKGFYF